VLLWCRYTGFDGVDVDSHVGKFLHPVFRVRLAGLLISLLMVRLLFLLAAAAGFTHFVEASHQRIEEQRAPHDGYDTQHKRIKPLSEAVATLKDLDVWFEQERC